MPHRKPKKQAPKKEKDELTDDQMEGVAGGGEASDKNHKEWIDVLSPPPPPPPPSK